MISFKNIPWSCTPRRWQIDAAACVKNYFAKPQGNPIVRAIMGSGKSILIAYLCTALETNETVVISTPTEYLVNDLHKDIHVFCQLHGKSVSKFYGREKRLGQVIVVCNPSMQNLVEFLEKHGRRAKLLIVDEAHKSRAPEYEDAALKMRPEHILGLSATPFRSNQKHTLPLFKTQIYSYGAAEAIRDGVVVPYVPVNMLLDPKDTLDVSCVKEIRRRVGPGLVNATSIADAEKFARLCCDSGIPARPVHSRMPYATVLETMEAVRTGQLKCAVHVNMLSEGANFPWLRWLGFRRDVGSRVRFHQELGRGMRAYDGKEFCEVMDFHDLLGKFEMDVESALGEEPPKAIAQDIAERSPGEILEDIKEEPEAVVMFVIENLVRRLVCACDTLGMLKGNRIILDKEERTQPGNAVQVATIKTAKENAWKYIPAVWQPVIEMLVNDAPKLRKGFLVDLWVSLMAIHRLKRFPALGSNAEISHRKERPVILDYWKSGGRLRQMELSEVKP